MLDGNSESYVHLAFKVNINLLDQSRQRGEQLSVATTLRVNLEWEVNLHVAQLHLRDGRTPPLQKSISRVKVNQRHKGYFDPSTGEQGGNNLNSFTALKMAFT